MSAQAPPPTLPPPAQQPNSLVDNTLTPAQTRYLLDAADVQQFLREKFPDVKDFKISVSVSPRLISVNRPRSDVMS